MVFNLEIFIIVFLIFICIWLIVLSILLRNSTSHYNNLTKGQSQQTLSQVLNALLKNQLDIQKKILSMETVQRVLGQDGKLHLQKAGIVRFNPFSDTGGTQSFSLAILDGENNGLILTSLYGRAGSRWYLKPIKAGHGVGVELAKEELSAIKNAGPLTDLNVN